jgi:hypothetical protein
MQLYSHLDKKIAFEISCIFLVSLTLVPSFFFKKKKKTRGSQFTFTLLPYPVTAEKGLRNRGKARPWALLRCNRMVSKESVYNTPTESMISTFI